MSEPVTNSDIEDVLSSIRRLISENPGEESAREPAETKADRPGRGKLVLTPDFRVPDSDTAPTAEDPAPDDQARRKPADDLEQRIAELEAAIGNAPDEWEPDGSELPETASGLVFLTQTATPETTREATSQAPAAPPDSAEADFVEVVEDGPGVTAEVLNYSAAGLVLEAEEVFDEDDDDAPAARQSSSPEDETQGDRPASEMPRPSTEDEEIVIDEEALRELVSQLVRSELKGRIGQRITRNIRRMVRREIKLALSLRDMD